ncbi:flavin reductase (NADPH) [Nilaparvata lugens]|uniref:flavin reductase (NADPH) n=1 Tax=Nilaparvata lugens TaxID=108931 RepID=UPI00193DF533|nr:flavin reductase (NADPH) [Nilaparvata lugens]
MEKVAIFGATGMTGLCALEAAVKSGLKIKLLVRDPAKIPENYKDKVEFVVGDVTNQDDVNKTVEGQDGVIVVLGTRNDLNATTALSTGLKNIVTAMKAYNVKPISVCLSAFLFYEPEKVPAIFKEINAEHKRMHDVLTACSELDWVAVFPPHIADQPRSEFILKHGESPGPRVISKYDLGDFLVGCLSKPQHYKKVVGIANVPK